MKHVVALLVAFLNLATVLAQEKWEIFTELNSQVVYPAVSKIGSSKAIILGGYQERLWRGSSKSVAQIEYVNGKAKYTSLPDMPTGHVEFPVVNFEDTLIVAIGGYNGSGVSSTVDAYSVRTNSWRTIGSLIVGRRQHVAYRFSDHEFLVVGGRYADLSTMATAEIFDIWTGKSRLITNYPLPINGGVAGLTSEGVGVVAGGRDGGPNDERIPGIYTYDDDNKEWTQVGSMRQGREAPMSGQMDDGSFVIAGGSFQESGPVIFTGEVIVERDGEFSLAGNIGYGVTYCGVAEHRKGEVFVVGGWLSDLTSTAACTFVNPTTGVVTPGPRLNIARRYTRAVSLEDTITNRRATFAIGGAAEAFNDRGTFTIEILEASNECEGGVTDVLALKNVRYNGQARFNGSSILLTDTVSFSAGAAWIGSKVAVATTYSTTFMFRLSDGNDHELKDGGPQGADGVALVIQNEVPSGVGDAGMGIGYHGLPHGLAVEFDSYLNGAYGDAAGAHAAVQVGDGMKLKASHTAPYLKAMTWEKMPPLVADGSTYHAKVEYDGAILRVWCDKTGEFITPLIEVGIDIAKELGLGADGRAWMGVTSATGFSTERHELMSWAINSCDPILVGVDETTPTTTSPLRIVPQPTHDLAMLEVDVPVTDGYVVVSTLSGQEVLRFTLDDGQQSVQLPSQSLISGTYVVRLVSRDRSQSILWTVLH